MPSRSRRLMSAKRAAVAVKRLHLTLGLLVAAAVLPAAKTAEADFVNLLAAPEAGYDPRTGGYAPDYLVNQSFPVTGPVETSDHAASATGNLQTLTPGTNASMPSAGSAFDQTGLAIGPASITRILDTPCFGSSGCLSADFILTITGTVSGSGGGHASLNVFLPRWGKSVLVVDVPIDATTVFPLVVRNTVVFSDPFIQVLLSEVCRRFRSGSL